MLFPILARAVTGKRGGALLTSMVQAALVMATGAPGTHGAASLLTYSLPGLTIEAVWLLSFRQAGGPVCCFIAGICANMAGNMAVNLLLFNLPAAPLLLALCVAALSGGLGGWAAYGLGLQIRRSGAWKAQPPSLGSGGAGGKAG
jgi:energy-coupling factor transport system substrate-specific component